MIYFKLLGYTVFAWLVQAYMQWDILWLGQLGSCTIKERAGLLSSYVLILSVGITLHYFCKDFNEDNL